MPTLLATLVIRAGIRDSNYASAYNVLGAVFGPTPCTRPATISRTLDTSGMQDTAPGVGLQHALVSASLPMVQDRQGGAAGQCVPEGQASLAQGVSYARACFGTYRLWCGAQSATMRARETPREPTRALLRAERRRGRYKTGSQSCPAMRPKGRGLNIEEGQKATSQETTV